MSLSNLWVAAAVFAIGGSTLQNGNHGVHGDHSCNKAPPSSIQTCCPGINPDLLSSVQYLIVPISLHQTAPPVVPPFFPPSSSSRSHSERQFSSNPRLFIQR